MYKNGELDTRFSDVYGDDAERQKGRYVASIEKFSELYGTDTIEMITGGALVVIIRIFGMYTDGAPFAVMLINLLAPMFGLVVTRPFGWKKGDK